SLARKYPLLCMRSVPTTESATWYLTPAAFSAANRLRPDVVKKSIAALSSNDGELDTSTSTCEPERPSESLARERVHSRIRRRGPRPFARPPPNWAPRPPPNDLEPAESQPAPSR